MSARRAYQHARLMSLVGAAGTLAGLSGIMGNSPIAALLCALLAIGNVVMCVLWSREAIARHEDFLALLNYRPTPSSKADAA